MHAFLVVHLHHYMRASNNKHQAIYCRFHTRNKKKKKKERSQQSPRNLRFYSYIQCIKYILSQIYFIVGQPTIFAELKSTPFWYLCVVLVRIQFEKNIASIRKI